MNRYCITRMKGKILSFCWMKTAMLLKYMGIPSRAACWEISASENSEIARKNIRAAFVEIAPGQPCYLPLDDLKNPVYTRKGPSPAIQQGDELVVQVSRDAIKTKAPALTTRISLSGVYTAVDFGHPGAGVSRKLPDKERERLKALGEGMLLKVRDELGEFGCPGIVLRTNSGSVPEAAVEEELFSLTAKLKTLLTGAVHRTCFSCLYRTPPGWLNRLLSLHASETERIVVEDAGLYQQAMDFLGEYSESLKERLVHYQDDLLPMHKLYSLERELEEALAERIWMKSGAYLVVQPTEALTVIDVNTGKYEKGKEKEEAVLKINLEAARETARQMRLRNLSGIVIVDFINMGQESSRRKVLEELRECLAMDPLQAHVVDMTKLELVELTRKKTEPPLAQQLL